MTGFELIEKLSYVDDDGSICRYPLAFQCGCKFKLFFQGRGDEILLMLIPDRSCDYDKEFFEVIHLFDEKKLINRMLDFEGYLLCTDGDDNYYILCQTSFFYVYFPLIKVEATEVLNEAG